MKRTILSIIPLAVIVILLSAYGNIGHYPNGAPAGYTGSPGDGQDCTACHGGSASSVSNWITSNIPASGYLPGQTYNMTVTVTGSGNKGFECSAQDMPGNAYGTFILGPGTELAGGGDYITHSSASSSNPKIWTFQWTAPSAGSGNVIMYGAFALGENNTRLSTLAIPENIGLGIGDDPVSNAVKIYPNPADKALGVNFNLASAEDVSVTLVNTASGQKTLLKQGNIPSGEYVLNYDCSSLAAGLYILWVKSTEQDFAKKVVIRH